MPCYETRLTTVELGTQTHLGALADALDAEGHAVTERGEGFLAGRTREGYPFRFQGGRFTVDERSSLAQNPNATKRAYGCATVKREAKRAGWQARFNADDTFVLTKRRF